VDGLKAARGASACAARRLLGKSEESYKKSKELFQKHFGKK